MDINEWRAHIEEVVAAEGQWIGLANGDGVPIMDAPPLISLSAPEQHLAETSVEAVFPAVQGSRFMDMLSAPGLGVDDGGELIPQTDALLLLVVRAGGERLAYMISHVVLAGESGPTTITVHGVDLVGELALHPAPSVPLSWAGAEFSEHTTDAAGAPYTIARRLAWVEFATVADGFTMNGPAVTVIRRLCQDSFDAVDKAYGWQDDPKFVTDFSGGEDTSPEVMIRVSDDYLWDTIAEPARAAGVGVEVNLWWPGDAPVVARVDGELVERAFEHPVLVVRVFEIKGD